MSAPRREQLDERVARLLREQRSQAILDNNGEGNLMLATTLEFESWFDGDPPGTHPEPGEQHQPAFGEPFLNLGFDGAWADNDDDRYWLRVPEDGFYRVSIDVGWNLSLILGGAGSGYHGLELWAYAEGARSLPPGTDPVGRDDPLGGVPPGGFGWSSSFGPTMDTRYLPEGHDSFNVEYSFTGAPLELTVDDSIRVITRAMEVDAFGAGDQWFALSLQGQVLIERIADLA